MTEAPKDKSDAEILLECAAEVLSDFVWEGETEIDDGAAAVSYSGETGDWALIAGTFPDEATLVVISALTGQVPEERLGPVVEYLSRANDGLPRGNFELDFAEHLVRFRTFLDVGELDVAELERTGILERLVRRIVLANVATMDIFLPGLRAVASGEMTPEEADAAAQDG